MRAQTGSANTERQTGGRREEGMSERRGAAWSAPPRVACGLCAVSVSERGKENGQNVPPRTVSLQMMFLRTGKTDGDGKTSAAEKEGRKKTGAKRKGQRREKGYGKRTARDRKRGKAAIASGERSAGSGTGNASGKGKRGRGEREKNVRNKGRAGKNEKTGEKPRESPFEKGINCLKRGNNGRKGVKKAKNSKKL